MKKTPIFSHHDVISVDQFTLEDVSGICSLTDIMKKIVLTKGSTMLLKGKIMTALFYEPSSRTYASFIAAMQRLGGSVIPIQGVTYSSVTKGETLPDTVRTFASYSDIIVLRHPEVGSARIAADFCDIPIINAGDGIGEHPTQALLDFYTIQSRFGTVDGLTIAMAGDLLNGRTVHSLSKLLSLCKGITIHLISPEALQLPSSLRIRLVERGLRVIEHETLNETLPTIDVLYVTRVQKERFIDIESYERLKHQFIITSETLKIMKREAIIMHPLPRVGEITMEVDLDKRAVYIREQMANGMYVRMALLTLLLESK